MSAEGLEDILDWLIERAIKRDQKDFAKLLREKGERMNWISVKDRLPEDGTRVMLYPNTLGEVGTGCFFAGTFEDEDKTHLLISNPMWTADDDPGEPFSPTHWMPLPEKPE